MLLHMSYHRPWCSTSQWCAEWASEWRISSWNCTGVVVFHLDFGGSSEEQIVCIFFLWPLTSSRCPPPGCSDHANHGPHYVHAACQHDGPYHTADEPSVPGHYRKCEYNACNYFAHTRSEHSCKLRCLVSLTHFHYCRQSNNQNILLTCPDYLNTVLVKSDPFWDLTPVKMSNLTFVFIEVGVRST